MKQLELFDLPDKKSISKTTRECNNCGVVLPLEEFPIAMKSENKTWYKKHCNECKKKFVRDSALIRKQNLSSYPSDNVCQLCNKESVYTLNCDHCHDTNIFRGWLCRDCNLGLGLLGDDKEGVKNALHYLERNKHEY